MSMADQDAIDALADALTRLADEWDAINHPDPNGARWFSTATHICADELRLVLKRTKERTP